MAIRFRNILVVTTALIPFEPDVAMANPLGSQVVGGAASVQGQGTPTVTVTQSTDRAIINWNTFNISRGETTQFIQPSSSSVTLNRVTGNLGPSFLDGTLTANGRIFLVNPDGILFGSNSKIDTAGFLATTNDVKNTDLMAGRYQFNTPGRPDASIVNQGTITAQNGGFAALVAPGVRNTGTITANLGTVGLASGNGFSLDFYGDKLITLGVSDSFAAKVIDVSTGQPLDALVRNDGKLKANGGRVELTAAAARQVIDAVINNTGVIEANSIGKKNGMIVLGAATNATKPTATPTQIVKLSGTLSAAGKRKNTKGGTVIVAAENIELASANIDASGRLDGGKVLIGGDVGGGNGNVAVASNPKAALESFLVPTASTVSIDTKSSIDASAKTSGDGGKVVVWSDNATAFNGLIKAQGGTQSGNGGFVETSGHQALTFDGKVDTGAARGVKGTLLLDPLNVIIADNAGSGVITTASIKNALATNDVSVTTGLGGTDAGNITVASSLIWTGNNSLDLTASHDIIINSGVTIGNVGAGSLSLSAGFLAYLNGGVAVTSGTASGTVRFLGTGKIDFSQSTGTVNINYTPPGGYANPTDFSPRILTNPNYPFPGFYIPNFSVSMWVNNVSDLQNINQNLAGNYTLANNIDASATAGWNSGAGFLPIGSAANPFTGKLSPGYVIDGLTIHSPLPYVGLFGYVSDTGSIAQVGLTNANITSSASGPLPAFVGGLVGENHGVLFNNFVTGTVKATNPSTVGGLVGANYGLISSSYTRAVVSTGAGGIVGGLVGTNASSFGPNGINASYSAGNFGSMAGTIGGLVGSGSPTLVSNSYYDIQIAPVIDTSGGISASTATLKTSLLSGLDPSSYALSANVNLGYPHLLWQDPFIVPATLKVFDPTAGNTPVVSVVIPPNNTQFANNLIQIDTTTANSTPSITPLPHAPNFETITGQKLYVPPPATYSAIPTNTSSSSSNVGITPASVEGNILPPKLDAQGKDLPSGQVEGQLTLLFPKHDPVVVQSLSNGQNQGTVYGDEAYQCSALIVRYAQALGVTGLLSDYSNVKNGKDVAQQLGQPSISNGKFTYVPNASSSVGPVIGAVLSIGASGKDTAGHVGIVQSVTPPAADGSFVVTLFDQNVRGGGWLQVTFTRGPDNSLVGSTRQLTGAVSSVVGWANPVGF